MHAQGESRDYYRASNSLLPCVLTHKKGIPISLAVVHAAVGRRAGLPIDCIGMPMHLINRMAVPESGEERFIDVFRGGELLTRYTQRPQICDVSWQTIVKIFHPKENQPHYDGNPFVSRQGVGSARDVLDSAHVTCSLHLHGCALPHTCGPALQAWPV